MTDLRECPFCGGEAELSSNGHRYYVHCPKCETDGPSQYTKFLEIQSPSELWNTRTQDKRIKELEEALSNLRQAQKEYIAFAKHGKHEPDYENTKELLGKLVGEAAIEADKILNGEDDG